MSNLQFADPLVAVNNLATQVTADLTQLLASVDELTPAEAEGAIAKLAFEWGRGALSVAWSEQCRHSTEADIADRAIDPRHVTLRSESDYRWSIMSTLGPILVLAFGYRDRSSGVGSTTRVPARELFPIHKQCRSSELCLQWECRLAIEHPFRSAQQSLKFFTHGAASLEDTTIAHHMVQVGLMVARKWLYRRPDDIRDILTDRATRDAETGRPLLYVSSDAHNVRRYVDAGWTPAWKNANGIRLWCIDASTGAIIHLGGEFTFDDCRGVAAIVSQLADINVLPENADFGDGVVAQYVLVTDGAQWFVDHIVPLLPDAVVVLDAYHAFEYLAEHAGVLLTKGTKAAKRLYRAMLTALLGPKAATPKRRSHPTRRGHKKRPRGSRRQHPKHRRQPVDQPAGTDELLKLLRAHEPSVFRREEHEAFIEKIERNSWRMDYIALRSRGIDIGSGAMESLHRTASQLRLKRPGAKWLRETAEATMNLRMLTLSGRWDEFWQEAAYGDILQRAFSKNG